VSADAQFARTVEAALGAVRGRTQGADALLREEDELTLRFETGRLKESALRRETGLNLRIVAEGRAGFAGTTDLAGGAALDDLVARALASAGQGDPCDLAWPAVGPLEAVRTFDDAAAGIDVASLAVLGRRVVERLQRPGWQVGASVDRTVERTVFANSAGSVFAFQATAISVSAEVTRIAGDDVLMAYDDVCATGVPADADLDALAQRIVTRMERGERVVEPPEGKLPVLFTPNGSGCIFLPLRQALSGKTVLQGISPFGEKLGQRLFDVSFDYVDDPLLDDRLASRPADDEGVPSRRLPLVERGEVRAFVYDLETASRSGTTSTGHGRRGTFGKPGISFANLVMREGDADEAALLREVGHGLLVEDLIGVGQGNVISGAFSHPVALAYRVDGGEITGRVKDAAVAGNAYDLLKRIRMVGRDGKWIGGSRLVPPMVLDAVNVARR
jgi:PmbA protein